MSSYKVKTRCTKQVQTRLGNRPRPSHAKECSGLQIRPLEHGTVVKVDLSPTTEIIENRALCAEVNDPMVQRKKNRLPVEQEDVKRMGFIDLHTPMSLDVLLSGKIIDR